MSKTTHSEFYSFPGTREPLKVHYAKRLNTPKVPFTSLFNIRTVK